MTAHDDLERQLNDFLRDGPDELPYQSFDAVRDRTDHTRQRVVLGPWRVPEMNKFLAIGLGAAAVVVAVLIGYQVFGSTGGGGVGAGPIATPEPTASPEPSPSPPASPPPLTQSFTSTLHGISLSYPEGWTAQAATEPWTDSTFPQNFYAPNVDVLYDPTLETDLFLILASQPIGDSTPEDWVALQMASDEGCSSHMAVTIDGFTGQIGRDECNVAVVTAAGLGYWFQLYTGSEAPATYDHAWFEEVLATVQLHPEDATD